MKLLALDTSTLVASVALLDGDRVVASREARVTTHSERLLPLVEELLAEAGVAPVDLAAIASGGGPGSFTGLRIGLATAKGLAFALGKPLVVISSLAALVLEAEAEARAGALVVSALDARKQEIYAALYRLGPGAAEPEVLAEPRVLTPDALADQMRRAAPEGASLVVVGDAASVYPEACARAGRVLSDRRATPSAAAVGRLALARARTGRHDDLATASPTYVRASEAELKWDGR